MSHQCTARNVCTAFYLPLRESMLDMSGQAARVLLALARRAHRGRGQVDLGDLCRSLRMGRQTALEALGVLEDAGLAHLIVRLGVVAFEIVTKGSKRLVKMEQWAGERLETMAPGTVLCWLAIQWHANPRDGLAWPSKLRLAGLTNRCKRTVERGVRSLTESGVMLRTKILWSKLPGFRWPEWKLTEARRNVANRLSVYAASHDLRPTFTQTLSPDRTELCRGVIKRLQNEACLLAEQERQAPPEGPRSIWAQLKAVGFGYGQIAWIRPRFGDAAIQEALRMLNERWADVRDRKKYVLAYLWRRCERRPG